MNDLQRIIAALEDRDLAETSALATVIDVQGSAYRRTGARMLITGDGRTEGTISGGCLEGDVCERARQVIATGVPVVATYDATSDADIYWGLGSGCNGVVRILIEPLRDGGGEVIDFIARQQEALEPCVVATVVRVEGHAGTRPGDHMVFRRGTVGKANPSNYSLGALVADDIDAIFFKGRSEVHGYASSSGSMEILLELIEPPVSLLIFGAGHDALPVARFAKELGWRVTVVDHRPGYATRERFPTVDEIIIVRPEDATKYLEAELSGVAVLMTHSYLADLELLRRLLPSPLTYIGMLGPKRRTLKLLEQLKDEGESFSEQQLGRLHAPVGVDIGAETPEEIALAILSEVRAVLANRSGGFLRDRAKPIHRQDEHAYPPTASGSKMAVKRAVCGA